MPFELRRACRGRVPGTRFVRGDACVRIVEAFVTGIKKHRFDVVLGLVFYLFYLMWYWYWFLFIKNIVLMWYWYWFFIWLECVSMFAYILEALLQVLGYVIVFIGHCSDF